MMNPRNVAQQLLKYFSEDYCYSDLTVEEENIAKDIKLLVEENCTGRNYHLLKTNNSRNRLENDNGFNDEERSSFASRTSATGSSGGSGKKLLRQQQSAHTYTESEIASGKTTRTNSLTRRSLRLPDCIVKSQFCPAVLRHSVSEQPPHHNHLHGNNSGSRSPAVSLQTSRKSVPQDYHQASPRLRQQQRNNGNNNNTTTTTYSSTCSNTPSRRSLQTNNSINNALPPAKNSNFYKVQTSNKERAKYKEAFESVDFDNDGRICPNELKRAFLKLGNIVTEAEVTRMINQVDTDCNGTVEFNEFVVMMQQYSMLKSECKATDSEDSDIYDAFKAFDHNGDGFIDSEEIKRTMAALGEDVSDSDVFAMISEADVDQDGKIDFEEFKKIMSIFKRRAAQRSK